MQENESKEKEAQRLLNAKLDKITDEITKKVCCFITEEVFDSETPEELRHDMMVVVCADVSGRMAATCEAQDAVLAGTFLSRFTSIFQMAYKGMAAHLSAQSKEPKSEVNNSNGL